MKTYEVTIPIAGVVYTQVTVPDDATPDDIFSAACEEYDAESDTIEWEFHKQIASGNVLHASTNEWYYEESK